MATASLDLDALSELALDVAMEAAELVMGGYRAPVTISEKSHVADLVTEYDGASERLIRARLAAESRLPVMGEEQGGTLSRAPTWVIDPIDGTTNFAHGHPFFAVSIGLLEQGTPRVGAVVAPALGTRWHGTHTRAFRDGAPIRVSEQAELARALLATGFAPGQAAEDSARNLAAFARLLPITRGLRRDGSAALDLCMTADGTLDGYWELRLQPWDVAGGAAIALGAGATITNLEGGPPDYTVGYLAATNGRIHDALLAQLVDN